MKVTREWLQHYFDTDLSAGRQDFPSTDALGDALTFHAFEIDGIDGDVLDVKVLPNRGADCLSHNGIAGELSAILNMPLKYAPLRDALPVWPTTDKLVITADPSYVVRHMGALVRGVKVGPSPAWLQEALKGVGQRSINNIVDALNFVMLDIGQPAGVFDMGKMQLDADVLKIDIRAARAGEKITALTGETYELSEGMFTFTDVTSGSLLDIAGIKGGLSSGVTEATTDIFISVGTYDGTLLRKAAQKLKLFTDASLRYQNRPSPELCAYGMAGILRVLEKVSGGTLEGVVDFYPTKAKLPPVSVSLSKINAILGSKISADDVLDVFKRLSLPATLSGEIFTVTPPFERVDVVIPEDLIEEVGRIIGYDKIESAVFASPSTPSDQARFRGMERMKDGLIDEGFVEVSTQSFAKKGDIALANPLDVSKPYLRTSLERNIAEAIVQAKLYAPLVLAPGEKPKLFEVGTVFPKEGEFIELRMSECVPAWGDAVGTFDNLSIAKLEDYGKDYVPKKYELGMYKPFSIYPFVLRDIALWCPSGTDVGLTKSHIEKEAGELLKRVVLFDEFQKDGRNSQAFRLVFESPERTLTDIEINAVMEKITAALRAAWYEPR